MQADTIQMAGVLGGLGAPELVVLLLVAAAIAIVTSMRSSVRFHGTTLVLRKFRIDESATSPALLEIAGRPSGLIGWLLDIMGLEGETTCTASESAMTFRTTALNGQLDHVVPMARIASTHCGYSKPLWLLVLGLLFAIPSLASIAAGSSDSVVGLILGAALITGYAFSKRLILTVETSGGMVVGLAFKRSVIENVAVDIAEVQRAIALINRVIAGRPSPSRVSPT
jgi:hypothetical protein